MELNLSQRVARIIDTISRKEQKTLAIASAQAKLWENLPRPYQIMVLQAEERTRKG